MNCPLISEYKEAIKAAEDIFEQLKHLRPLQDDDGLPLSILEKTIYTLKDNSVESFVKYWIIMSFFCSDIEPDGTYTENEDVKLPF